MASPNKTVLILDADEATRDLYRRGLGQRFTVITAATEQDAWRAMESESIDGLVLEPEALEDEAWSFIARLRTLERYRNLPIVLCSTLDARRRGAEVGAAAYLIKPVTPAMLSRTLQSALQASAPLAGR
jgi:DNA-binding response OmpR family regulator